MKYVALLFILYYAVYAQNLDEIRKELNTNNFVQKTQTLQQVLYLYEEATPLIPDLLKIIENERGQNRYLAIRAIGNIGPLAESARKKLEELLQDSQDLYVTYYCINALGQIKSMQSIDILQQKMQHQDANIRAAVIAAIHMISPPNTIEIFQKYVSDHDDALVQKAIITCLQARPFNKTVSEILLNYLRYPDNEVCFLAVQLLEITPYNADKVIPAYRELLQSKDPRIVASVLGDFAIAKKLPQPAIEDIIPFLSKKKYRMYAMNTICRIGEPCLPYINKLLLSNDNVQKSAAIDVLSRLGQSHNYVSLFIKMSVEKDTVVHKSCIAALQKIKKVPATDIEYLRQQLLGDYQAQAIQTIVALRLTVCIADLLKLCVDASSDLRNHIYAAIAKIATPDTKVDKVLLEVFDQVDNKTQKTLLYCFGRIKSKAAIPKLRTMLKSDHSHFVLAIIELGNIEAVEAIEDIHNIFVHNPNRIIKNYCMHAMMKMGTSGTKVFFKCLDEQDTMVRIYSLTALSQVQPTLELMAKLQELSKKNVPRAVRRKASQLYVFLQKRKPKED